MSRLGTFAFASLVALGVLASGAAAETLTMPDGSPIAVKGHDRVVLSAVEVQTAFLGDWSANQPLRGQLNSAVDTIVTGAYLDALNPSYGVGHGVHDSTVDIPHTFPNNTLSDTDLQKLIVGWVGNPLKPLSANRLYLFFVPPGVTVTPLAASPDFGYHGYFFSGTQTIVYAVINTSGDLDGATSVTSHEVAEAATNPTGRGYFEDQTVSQSGEKPYQPEIGDFTDGPVLNGKQYPYRAAVLNGVRVQLLIDPNGNVIQVPGATPLPAMNVKPLRLGKGVSAPGRR